jgi:LPXTG-motif cell wall-anchored protein
MLRTKAYRVLATTGGIALLGVATASPALATVNPTPPADPPGNNGTVKIDNMPFDDAPDNEPHDGCVFQVDFYGFDKGDLSATVKFTLIPPTADDDDIVVDDVPIGEDAAGGGTDLDASATYDLSSALASVVPHPQQGIHLKLTVHAAGSQGADTKFKVFWVTGCGSVPTTTSTTKPDHGGGSTTTTSTPESSTTSTTKPDHGGGSTTTTSSGTSPSSSGPTSTAPTAGNGNGNGNGAAGQLPHTGSNAAPLAAAGLGLVGLGAGVVVTARRLRLHP